MRPITQDGFAGSLPNEWGLEKSVRPPPPEVEKEMFGRVMTAAPPAAVRPSQPHGPTGLHRAPQGPRNP